MAKVISRVRNLIRTLPNTPTILASTQSRQFLQLRSLYPEQVG